MNEQINLKSTSRVMISLPKQWVSDSDIDIVASEEGSMMCHWS